MPVDKRNEYYEDLCSALVQANISMNEVQCEPLTDFLEKYTPTEKRQMRYFEEDIPAIHDKCMVKMRSEYC